MEENGPEIVQEMGNMFLIREDGVMKQKPNTPKNELKYKHGLYEVLHGTDSGLNNRTVLSDEDSDEYMAVAPTKHDDIYELWRGDPESFPITNPPSEAYEVLKAVRDAVRDPPDYTTFKHVYSELAATQVRREVINSLVGMFPAASVIPEEKGWVVEGIFVVTWDARVFLRTTDVEDGSSYEVAGGITETEQPREFLSLVPKDIPKEETIQINGTKFVLTERELEFLAKVQWLVNYDEMLEDEAFWRVVERHVRGDRFFENENG